MAFSMRVISEDLYNSLLKQGHIPISSTEGDIQQKESESDNESKEVAEKVSCIDEMETNISEIENKWQNINQIFKIEKK
jgi:hypothetical protein